MSARTSAQRTHGIGEESSASAGDKAVPASSKQQASAPEESRPDEERVSPDPLRGTDRYRLVMPFHLRL